MNGEFERRLDDYMSALKARSEQDRINTCLRKGVPMSSSMKSADLDIATALKRAEPRLRRIAAGLRAKYG